MTTDAIGRAPDFPARAARVLATGSSIGLVLRAPGSTAASHSRLALEISAARQPGGSALFVHARPDLARAVEADGVQLRGTDLSPAEARKVFPRGWIGVSVHHQVEAETALAEGADYLVAGNLFESTSHPGRPGKGLDWLASLVRLGAPVIAIGGITRDRVPSVREAGAWGIAAISAIWDQVDPAAAARELMETWEADGSIRLTVNGEPRRVPRPATLQGLLQALELDPRAVVVELNRRIVRRPELAETRLTDGDAVELVHFVGGG